jgi:hypothetical protein
VGVLPGLFFITYHGVKRKLDGYFRARAKHSSDLAVLPGRTAAELVAGGFAGIAACGPVIPIDVVKTRLQGQGVGSAATIAASEMYPSTHFPANGDALHVSNRFACVCVRAHASVHPQHVCVFD